MKLFVIAGEPSGDLHGGNLIKAIQELRTNVDLEGFGGPNMAAQGVKLHRNLSHLSFMGFTEVIRNLGHVITNFRVAKQAITAYAPDALVLIDYPGFNLRLAKWAKARGIRVIWYIAPQTWAWKEGRVHTMRQCIDQLLCILPFEESYFRGHGVNAQFVGHPLMEASEWDNQNSKENRDKKGEPERPIIALLPGSRAQEVKRMLPAMLQVVRHFPEHRFVIGCSSNVDQEIYQNLAPNGVDLWQEGTSGLLQQASAALVTSGTATLETALHRVPQVVCYKGNPLSILLARWLIQVRYISLVNIILDREAVPELIQAEMNQTQLRQELELILSPSGRKAQLENYQELALKLGGPGASVKASQLILVNLPTA